MIPTWRTSSVIVAALVAWWATSVSVVDAGRADFPARVLTTLSGPVENVAFDGTRAVAILRSPGSLSFTLEFVDLSSGRSVTTAPMARRSGASVLALAGTTALVNVLSSMGLSEVGGSWNVVPIDGGRVRVIRRYYTYNEGAALTCCPIILGQGAAGQGTVLAYVTGHHLYRVAGRRSLKLQAGIKHLFAVNKRRLLVERDDGSLALVSASGRTMRVLAATAAIDSIAVAGALQGNTALDMRRRSLSERKVSYQLDVYRASTGALLHSWNLGSFAEPSIQLYGDLAIYRGTVIRLEDGRRAKLPHATREGSTHLSRDGLIYTTASGESHHDLASADSAARGTRGTRHPAQLSVDLRDL